jgi:hypothetical protein
MQQPVQVVAFVARHLSLPKSNTVPLGHFCIIGPNVVHRKNIVQLNGNGAISPSSQPVGLGAKSHVADDDVDVDAVRGVGRGASSR